MDDKGGRLKPRTIAQLPWIKMRVGLPRDPAVFYVAQRLRLKPPHVVGLLLELWGWADGVTSDGRILGVTMRDVDRIVGCKGFAAALAAVPEHPWLEAHDGYIILPRFDRHNGATAKRRANDAERTRADRMDPDSPRFIRELSASEADPLRARGEERRVISNLTPTRSADGPGETGPAVCSYCGATEAQVGRRHQADRFRPLAHGGPDIEPNIVVACHRCNQAKKARVFETMDEARTWLHRAYWTSNRKRWIEHRAIAFGGKPPPGIDPDAAPSGVSSYRNGEADAQWALVTDAIAATSDGQERSARVGPKAAAAVAACGGWAALGAMRPADGARAFREAYRRPCGNGAATP